jgi:methionyl-tRNA formyltransferase
VRICFAGTPEVAVPSLKILATASDHDVVAVVTRPDAPAGRGKRLRPSPVAAAAQELGLPVLKPAHPKDPEFQEELRALAVEAVAVVAYGALIPDSALGIPRHGWINLHFSLLPAWRGAAPVQHAVLHGDPITGATTFQIVHDLDAGPVYGVMTYAVPARASSGDVLNTLAIDGSGLLVRTLDAIADGSARPEPQPVADVSYASKLTSADGRIDWSDPALGIDRRIRACTPEPGAWTTVRGERLKLGPVLAGDGPDLEPGSVFADKHHVWVGSGTQPLLLERVAPAGKSWMDAAAWARGARLAPDEKLGEAL